MIGAELARDNRGLTLMELVVVMGIFSITVAMASDIFLLSNRAQRRVLTGTVAQNDVRFALESMVREVRTGSIDYASYAASGGVSVPTDHLLVVSAIGDHENFYLETKATVCPAGITKCLALSLNNGAAQALSSAGIAVDKLSFFISPQQNPFSQASNGLYGANTQPTVTMALQVHTANTPPQDTQTVAAQTTAAARTYAR